MKDIDTIREALEFYANSEWNDDYPGGITYYPEPEGKCRPHLDTGQKAKNALAALSTIDSDRMALAEKLRQYLPHCGKQDMTNGDRELVEWVDSIIGSWGLR